MIIDANWTPPPMVRDLPHDSRIAIACKSCQAVRSETVSDLIARKLGAEYIDLLEMQTRCNRPGCGRAVAFTCEGVPLLRHPRQPTRTSRPMAPKLTRPRPLSQLDLFGRETLPEAAAQAGPPF